MFSWPPIKCDHQERNMNHRSGTWYLCIHPGTENGECDKESCPRRKPNAVTVVSSEPVQETNHQDIDVFMSILQKVSDRVIALETSKAPAAVGSGEVKRDLLHLSDSIKMLADSMFRLMSAVGCQHMTTGMSRGCLHTGTTCAAVAGQPISKCPVFGNMGKLSPTSTIGTTPGLTISNTGIGTGLRIRP